MKQKNIGKQTTLKSIDFVWTKNIKNVLKKITVQFIFYHKFKSLLYKYISGANRKLAKRKQTRTKVHLTCPLESVFSACNWEMHRRGDTSHGHKIRSGLLLPFIHDYKCFSQQNVKLRDEFKGKAKSG